MAKIKYDPTNESLKFEFNGGFSYDLTLASTSFDSLKPKTTPTTVEAQCLDVKCHSIKCSDTQCSAYSKCRYYYKRYTNCDCKCNCDCNCGDSDTDSCFIDALLLTTEGYKNVQEVRIGDVLVGPDGKHKIVGVTSSALGDRRVQVFGENILTEEHVVLIDEKPRTASENWMHQYTRIRTDKKTNVRGTYEDPKITAQISVDKSICLKEYSPDAIAINPIVESGNWVYLEGGVVALISHKVNE